MIISRSLNCLKQQMSTEFTKYWNTSITLQNQFLLSLLLSENTFNVPVLRKAKYKVHGLNITFWRIKFCSFYFRELNNNTDRKNSCYEVLNWNWCNYNYTYISIWLPPLTTSLCKWQLSTVKSWQNRRGACSN